MLEDTVVILKGEDYSGGPGYNGPILWQLGFPAGPYLPGVARIFIRQAKKQDPSVEFETRPYKQK